MNTLITWWLLPAVAVWAAFRWMVWSDKLSLSDLETWALSLMVMLSIFYPLGIIVLAGIVIDAGCRKMGILK